jgi:tRNA nucleotidyltransferase/poly(A) polymerase
LKKSERRNWAEHRSYAGRWVALIGNRVVGHGGTPEQALRSAKNNRPKEIPVIHYVPSTTPLEFPPTLNVVREAIPHGIKIYLVGGAIRDALLNQAIHDFDFILHEGAIRIARKVANTLGGAYYLLDEKRETARVIFKDEYNKRVVLDFAKIRGDDLESDLKDRDFTLNALAVNLQNPQEVFDPLGGARDLLSKTLRECSQSSFLNDPVRIIRGVRLAVCYGFRIQPETKKSMRKAVQLLEDVSKERLRDELFRILGGLKPSISIRALDKIGALEYILPELSGLKGIHQFPPHNKGVWEHSLDTIAALETLIDNFRPQPELKKSSNLIIGMGSMRLGRFRRKITEHIQTEIVVNRSVRSILFFAALYHDIGKLDSKQIHVNGRIRFEDHPAVGKTRIGHRARALHLSNAEISRLKLIINHHMDPTNLARIENEPIPLSMYKFFRDTGVAGIDIALLSMADLLATYGPSLPQERWGRQLEIVRGLMDAWWEQPEVIVNPLKVVTGSELMEKFGLESGPYIGRLLEMVREAQVEGEVKTQLDAFNFVKGILK